MSSGTPGTPGGIYFGEIEGIGGEGDPYIQIHNEPFYLDDSSLNVGEWVCIKRKRDDGPETLNPPVPKNSDLPFFAYGIFQQGEVAYHRIDGFLNGRDAVSPGDVPGKLVVEDGMPMLESGDQSVSGNIIVFDSEDAERAYAQIGVTEPMSHYSWEQTETLGGQEVNILTPDIQDRREPVQGQRLDENHTPWKSRPSFKELLQAADKIAPQHEDVAGEEFYKLQAAYLLIFSGIEQYISLAWKNGPKENNFVARKRFAKKDSGFGQAIGEVLTGADTDAYRRIYDPRSPEDEGRAEMINLDDPSPSDVIEYLYSIRSTITHRGKGEPSADEDLLRRAFEDVSKIFGIVITERYQ